MPGKWSSGQAAPVAIELEVLVIQPIIERAKTAACPSWL
jgi:hypothetical protein